MNMDYVSLVETAAEARHEDPIPRAYIIEVLDMVDRGEAKVKRYPLGVPCLRSVFEIAKKLHAEKHADEMARR